MQVLQEFDLNALNREQIGRNVSVYSLIPEPKGFLVGCGLWDRVNMPHSNEVKNATPGAILRVDQQGHLIEMSPELANIVYPLTTDPWGDLFVGCRTGAFYTMDLCLSTTHRGDVGNGVYGIEHSRSLNRFIIGGRKGTLFQFDSSWKLMASTPVSADRLWNICLDWDDRFLWATSYNGFLFKIDLLNGQVVHTSHQGAGGLTYVRRLSTGELVIGCFAKQLQILQGTRLRQRIQTDSPVCFIEDLPHLGVLVATGYKGQIWVFDYNGRLLDSFLGDAKENNPIWIATRCGSPSTMAFAWANGIIRVIDLTPCSGS